MTSVVEAPHYQEEPSVEVKDLTPIEYDDPQEFMADLEAWPHFQQQQESRIRRAVEGGADRHEAERAYLESDTYKDLWADFVEGKVQGGQVGPRRSLAYHPEIFFQAAEPRHSSEIDRFGNLLEQYHVSTNDLRVAVKRGDKEGADYLTKEKMSLHEEMGELLHQIGIAPSHAAGRQLVRMISIDRGFDTEWVLRFGDVQRRQARAESSRVVYGE